MKKHFPVEPEPEPEPLSEQVAERLLARASELDAVGSTAAKLADLRVAAMEAGISASAFDAALAELQAAQTQLPEAARNPPPRRSRLWTLTAAGATLIAAFALWVSLRAVPAGQAARPDAGMGVGEETILLQCLSGAEAAQLLRPLLAESPGIKVYTSASAPRVLTVRAPHPTQLERVKSALEEFERPGSASCATRPTGGATP